MKIAVSALATTLLASLALLVWTPAGRTSAQAPVARIEGHTGTLTLTQPPGSGGEGIAGSISAWAPVPVPAQNAQFAWVGGPHADPLAGSAEAAAFYSEEIEAAQEAQKLTGEFQQASGDEDREELREQLREALVRQFDAQQSRRQLEIQRIEERLAAYREKVQKREDAKDMIVDRRLDQLTGLGDDLGWEETQVGPHAGHPFGPTGLPYPATAPRLQAAPAIAIPPSVAPPATPGGPRLPTAPPDASAFPAARSR